MTLYDLYDNFKQLPLTENIAQEFQEEQGDFRLNGYAMATSDSVELLSKILKRNADYETLKKELTEFIEDRKKFLGWLDERFNSENAKYIFV